LYIESGLKPTEIVKRIQTVLKSVPVQERKKLQNSESSIISALIDYVTHCLKLENERYIKYAGNTEDFYTPYVGKLPILMGFTPSLRMYESLRMSEVTLATRSRDSAQPIRMQVSFELRTFLSFLTFLTLE